MRKKVRLTHALAVGVLVAGLTVVGSASAKENPANDCLVGLQGQGDSPDVSVNITTLSIACTDGDACDADGATNNSCSFRLKGCVNLPGVSGCTAQPIKKVKFVTAPTKNIIQLTPDATAPSSVCGSFVDLVVPLKKKKKTTKPGKGKITATATANVKPFGRHKDKDVYKFTCNPCTDPSGSCVPPKIQLKFVTAGPPAATTFCGDPALVTPPDAPTSGTVTADTNETIPLGTGCLYIGGGGGIVPGGMIPDGSSSMFELSGDTSGTMTVKGSAPTDGASRSSCTVGAGPDKACVNDLSTWPNLTTCTTDDDCPKTGPGNTTAAGSCVEKPNCLFGPPLPINGSPSTCVINTLGTTASGTVTPSTGAANINLPLRSHTFITPGDQVTPCPTCENNVCVGGLNNGKACTTTSAFLKTSIDCPPSAAGGAYLPEFEVNLANLTTGSNSKTDSGGIFCPEQKTLSAFGTQNQGFRPLGDPVTPPLLITTITENGSTIVGNLTDGAPHAATLSTVFCIPATGSPIIDGAADLAGPGAVSLPGTLQILQ